MRKVCFILSLLAFLASQMLFAQPCPSSGTSTIGTNPNVYYPGTASVAAGATQISIGAPGIGTGLLAVNDLVLVIQMQGAEFNTSNTANYGSNTGSGLGYLNNGNNVVGQMEYAVVSAVNGPGTLITLSAPLVNAYTNRNANTSFGQYRFQVIKVPVYYDLTLSANINTPVWNGSVGGVTVLRVVNNLDMAGFTINAAGAGFRGGGSRQLTGGGGVNTDFRTLASVNTNASKGEGISGTPRFVFANAIVNTGVEGYPNGSHGRGAPGNAGGGGSDGNPGANDQNTGGGGGGNGGAGGRGGNGWTPGTTSSATGGSGGAIFAQRAASRVVMGGGGGGGTSNNATGTPGSGNASSGARGGGIVIVGARFVTTSGTINASGANANSTIVNDASGGGGAGGSILVTLQSGFANLSLLARGGNGGSNSGGGTGDHGPGGGGGGGVIYSNGSITDLTPSRVAGGTSGTTQSGGVFGSANGGLGSLNANVNPALFPANYSGCLLLPAQMLDFRYKDIGTALALEWQVVNEVNVKEYIVERSVDGTRFSVIGSVPYRSGGSGIKNYRFEDNLYPMAYYRIKTLDIDGQYEYSKTLLYRRNQAANLSFSIYPNPAKELLVVEIPGRASGFYTFTLADQLGRTVFRTAGQTLSGRYVLKLPANLQGLYILTAWSEATQQHYREQVMISR